MVKNLGNYAGFLDGSNDFQFATAEKAVFDVDFEYPFQQSGPADATRRRGMGRIVLRSGAIFFVYLRIGNNCGTQLGIRREYPMETNKVESWTRH